MINQKSEHFIRLWLMGVLLFLPFQHLLGEHIILWNYELSLLIRRIDDLTILILLPLAIIKLYKNREIYNWPYIILLFSILVFVLFGIISGIVNGNSMLITAHGTLDYIRNFFVIFIYAAFIKEFSEFNKIFRCLLLVAVFMGLIAIVHEILALVSRYVLEKDITDNAAYFIRDIFSSYRGTWRFGVYRSSSIMAHYNIYGLYSLLILTIYLSIRKKVNAAVFFVLSTGVLVSISRVVYAGFLSVMGFQLFRKRWTMLTVVIPLVIILYFMVSLPDFKVMNYIEAGNETVYSSSEIPYRVHALDKALEVWKDHPLLGVGPGMFGGGIALKNISPVYEEYGFTYILRWYKSLDQFWPQMLAETGIAGTGMFSALFISLFIMLNALREQGHSEDIRNYFSGLILFTLALLFYTFGSNLNINPVLYTFFAFIGMGAGCVAKK